ncbi:MAG: hypothetical protein ACXWTH_04375 [Methylosarcina sp.]
MNLQQPQALTLAVETRRKAAEAIGPWSHGQFDTHRLDIDLLVQQNNWPAAYRAAEALLQQAVQAGKTVYPEAAYDIAIAYFYFGRVLSRSGHTNAALASLQQARQRFQLLADGGTQEAVRMVSVSMIEFGDCLKGVGQLKAAAEVYQQAIELSKKHNAIRDVAVGKIQLATVRYYKKNMISLLPLILRLEIYSFG